MNQIERGQGLQTIRTTKGKTTVKAIIVGAGIAGLSAARHLKARGLEVLVVEASPFVGGRVRSAPVGESLVGVGATWIHQPNGNPITELCDEFGLDRTKFDLGDLSAFQQLYDKTLLDDASSALVRAIEDDFWEQFNPDGAESGESAADLMSGYFDARPKDIVHRRARALILNAFETELCAPAHLIGASNFLAQTRPYDGGDEVIVGGYSTLVDCMAAGLALRLSWPVARISQRYSCVEVIGIDGTVETAAHVIVTVPLGVLKAQTIRFEPAPPAPISFAVDQLGFGVFEKVVLQFKERWWTTQPTPNGMHLLNDTTFRYWLDISHLARFPTLVAHVAGPPAENLSPTPASRISEALTALRSHFDVVPVPSAAFATTWQSDPWTRGGYTRLPPRVDGNLIDDLAQPFGRVVLAGEHTSRWRYGYVDGALESGIRAAKQVIGLAAS